MTPEPNITYRGGPRDGEPDSRDRLPATIGDGAEGGLYQRADETDDGLVVYRWQELTEAQRNALVRGDLRANQD